MPTHAAVNLGNGGKRRQVQDPRGCSKHARSVQEIGTYKVIRVEHEQFRLLAASVPDKFHYLKWFSQESFQAADRRWLQSDVAFVQIELLDVYYIHVWSLHQICDIATGRSGNAEHKTVADIAPCSSGNLLLF